MIYAFIEDQRAAGRSVESVCEVLTSVGIRAAARSYRRARAAGAVLAGQVLALAYLANAIHALAFRYESATGAFRLTPAGLYGRRKMTALLRRQGHDVSRERVHRAMRLLRHNGIRRGRMVRTTIPAKDGNRAGDLLNRDFTAAAPNLVWVTDFTYVRTWAGFVYVAFIVDVYAQRIIAWHAATSKVTDLVMTPLTMALWERDRQGRAVEPGELIHHSDAGSQYTSIRLTEHLALEDIAPSIGTVADAYDNCLMESIIGLYKTECIDTTIFHDGPYKTVLDVELATAAWVGWYNEERLHSSIDYTTPAEYETAYYAALSPEKQFI
jgi:putative transposase